MPADYTFHARASRAPDDDERVLLYAFDYASSSKPQRRREHLHTLLERLAQDTHDVAASFATGLYDVLLVAKAYRGEVLVRSSGRLAVVDFWNTADATPRLTLPKVPTYLASLPGTTIALRIPLELRADTSIVKTDPLRRPIPARASSPPQEAVLSLGPDLGLLTKARPWDAYAIDLEVPLSRLFQQSAGKLVCVVLDNLPVSPKELRAIVELLARIPRKGAGLAILVSDPQLQHLLADQSQRSADESTRSHVLRYPSLVICSDSSTEPSVYGISDHADSTYYLDGVVITPHCKVPAPDIPTAGRAGYISALLSLPPALHREDGAIYLIESRYYTRQFYQVSRLADSPTTRSAAVSWLSALLHHHPTTRVLCTASSIRSIVDDAAAAAGTHVAHLDDSRLFGEVLRAALMDPDRDRLAIVSDVICTGGLQRRFLALLPKHVHPHLIAFVDARPDAHSYLSVQRADGTLDVAVACALREPVDALPHYPKESPSPRIRIIDRQTNAPAAYASPKRGPVDLSLLLDAAVATDALRIGHYEAKRRHYLYFLSLERAFAHLRSTIISWLAEELAALLAVAKTTGPSVAALCIPENTPLLAFVMEVARAQGIATVTPLSLEDLYASSPPFAANHEAVWVIMPAMATGRTLARAFEYANRLGAGHARFSVVVTRLDLEWQLFFQKVATYDKSGVDVSTLFTFPVHGYEAGACPACHFRDIIRGLAEAAGSNATSFGRLLRAYSDTLRALEGATAFDSASSFTDPNEVWLRATYTSGRTAADARKLLVDRLTEPGWASSFARAVGRGIADPDFRMDVLRDIVYEVPAISDAWHQYQRSPPVDQVDAILQFRGFAHILGVEVQQALPALLNRAKTSAGLFAALLIEAARLSPTMPENSLLGITAPSSELAEALSQVSARLEGAAVPPISAAESFMDLHWHLVRSSGLGNSMEALRLACRAEDVARIRQCYAKFCVDGIDRAKALLKACASTHIWHRLKELVPVAESSWKDLGSALDDLDDLITQLGPAQEPDEELRLRLLEQLRAVDERRAVFVVSLESLAISPIRPCSRVLSYFAERYGSLLVDVPTSYSFEPLLCHASDFDEVLWILLDNVARHASEAQTVVRFSRTEQRITMLVSQDRAWNHAQRAAEPNLAEEMPASGGLKRLPLILRAYDATMRLDPDACPDSPYLEVSFLPCRGLGLPGESLS